jgi:hypothetical protein
VFLVIANQMLQRRNHTKIFHASAVAGRRKARENRVFGKRLESSSTQRTSLDIDRGTQQNVCALGFAFCGEKAAKFKQ